MKICDLLKKLRLERNWSQEQAAARLAVSQSYYSDLESGKYQPIKPKTLNIFIKRIARAFHLSEDEIKKRLKGEYLELQDYISIRKVPVLNSISAGELLNWTDMGYPPGWADEWIEVDSGVTDPNAFALRIHGDSMEPEFREGEYVVISPNTQWEDGDYVVVANSSGEKALKKIKTSKDSIILISLNPKYEPVILTKDENPKVIGKVTRKVKKY